MKYLFLLLLLIPSLSFGDSELTSNGKTAQAHIIQSHTSSIRPRPYLDFEGGITCVDSGGKSVCTGATANNIFGLNHQIVVVHSNNTQTYYEASANTDIARGNAFLAAISAVAVGDAIYVSAGGYNIQGTQITQTFQYNIIGAGRDVTKITSNYDGNCLTLFSNSEIAGVTLNFTFADYILNVYTSGATNVLLKDMRIIGDTDPVWFDNSSIVFMDNVEILGGIVGVQVFNNSKLYITDSNLLTSEQYDYVVANQNDATMLAASGSSIYAYNTLIATNGGTTSTLSNAINNNGGNIYLYGCSIRSSGVHTVNDIVGNATVYLDDQTIFDPAKSTSYLVGVFTDDNIYFHNDSNLQAYVGPAIANPGVALSAYDINNDVSSTLAGYGGDFEAVVRQGTNGTVYSSFVMLADGTVQFNGTAAGTHILLNPTGTIDIRDASSTGMTLDGSGHALFNTGESDGTVVIGGSGQTQGLSFYDNGQNDGGASIYMGYSDAKLYFDNSANYAVQGFVFTNAVAVNNSLSTIGSDFDTGGTTGGLQMYDGSNNLMYITHYNGSFPAFDTISTNSISSSNMHLEESFRGSDGRFCYHTVATHPSTSEAYFGYYGDSGYSAAFVSDAFYTKKMVSSSIGDPRLISTTKAMYIAGPSTLDNGNITTDGSGNMTVGGNLTLSTYNLVTDTTTGTKIATGTTQKLGFFNATPVVQQGATTDLGTALSNLGLRASGTAYPMTTSGAVTLTGQLAINTLAPTVGTATASTIASFDASKNLVSLALATYPSLTELSYVKGVTSAIQTQINTKGAGTVTSITAGTGLTGGAITTSGTINSSAVEHITYQPGLLTAVNATIGVYYKASKASTVDNIIGSAVTFSCIANPTITVYECGTSTTCASSPTTIGTVTVTANGTATVGTVSNSAVTAGDYIGFAMTAGTCASVDIAATVQIHAN